ncbi:hypothetical protein [Saccharothrix algeriensis]|uniref:Uncharacterized protein n=1 Tax=Saccharothrix algeriensis TaxID=173560 RepID=A0A8T8HV84_9PSEU|nr:hypothetical protein [Saccharothrix algeriensis]MBM7813186.1 hypothetical protein [Saccharothrix algeriensis]QTR01764.1 hypothetical protein J7S33_21000 [Saccharothrix algeriensis]
MPIDVRGTAVDTREAHLPAAGSEQPGLVGLGAAQRVVVRDRAAGAARLAAGAQVTGPVLSFSWRLDEQGEGEEWQVQSAQNSRNSSGSMPRSAS